MPEILTESFCERCGTRYTFESAAPTKAHKLGKFKTISKGLKNYVMSDDTSLDEAMAAARSDDELEQTAHQLDAFHSTFNFCMNCRQYTCANCWNEAESRCLTCAPHLGQEILPAPFPEMPAQAEIGVEAWPEADIKPAAAAAFAEAVASAETEEVVEIDAGDRLDRLSATSEDVVPSWLAEAEAEALAQAEARAAFEAEQEAYVTAELPFEEDVPEAAAEVVTPEPEPVAAIAEPEAEGIAQADVTQEPVVAEPEPVAEAVAAEPEPVVAEAVAAEAVAAEPVAAEPEPVAANTEPEPVVARDAGVVVAAGLAAAAAVAEPEPDAETPEIAPIAAEAEPIAPAGVDGQAAAASQQTSKLFAKFRPGQNIDAELAAYEAAVAEQTVDAVADAQEPVVAEVAPEPVVAEPVAEIAPEPVLVVAPEPVVAAEPEPVVAQPEPVAAESQPEPVAAELAVAAAAEPEPAPEPIAAEAPEPARTDVVEQPTWRIVAPEAPTNGHAPEELPAAATAIPPVPQAPEAPPQWPTTPEWPQANVSHLTERPPTQSAAMDALWAASVRDVVAPVQGAPAGTVQPCNSCGLSLSANARFCRRCGTRQGG